MKQLELKHLAPYQEYKVKLLYKGSICNIAYLSTKRIAFIRTDGIGEVIKMTWEQASGKIKLLLKPLSDLTKKDINGESWGYGIDFSSFVSDVKNQFVSISIWKYLLSKHFDVFGLIPEGLAINVKDI